MILECPNCHYENPEKTNFCGKCATPLPHLHDVFNRQTQTIETPREELTTGSTLKRKKLTVSVKKDKKCSKILFLFYLRVGNSVTRRLVHP